MENQNSDSVAPLTDPFAQHPKKNFFQKLPKSQQRSLLLISALALLLPVVTAMALLATRLNPRAFLPATPPITPPYPTATISATLTPPAPTAPPPYTCTTFRSSVGGTCTISTKTKFVIQNGRPQRRTTTVKGYNTVSYTCPDGFKSTYVSRTCQTMDQLNNYANSACKLHVCSKPFPTPITCKTGINSFTTGASCKTSSGNIGMLSAKYQCYDGFTGIANLNRCASEAELRAIASKVCTSHSNCPTPTVASNTPPQITTTSLSIGSVNRSYSSPVEAIDINLADNLNMTISGLPFGLYQGPCAVPLSGGKITCSIVGTPVKSGLYSVQIKVSDNKGGSVSKTVSLTIK